MFSRVLCLILALSGGFYFSNKASATDYFVEIERGEMVGRFLDPGDRLFVVYPADGSAATASWVKDWASFWNRGLVIANVWYTYDARNWYHFYSTDVEPWWRSYGLYLSGGFYVIEIKVFGTTTGVTMAID